MALAFQIFGNAAFEKRTSNELERRKRKNSSLFEVWTVSLAKLGEADALKLVEFKDIVKEKLQNAIEKDDEFFRSISLATQKRDHVKIRYEYVKKIINEVCHA
jgi:hypothetical protein